MQLEADVARLRQVLEFQDGPVVVAGHSYGGQIMTALGTDAPNAAGLVYVAAFGTTSPWSRILVKRPSSSRRPRACAASATA